MISPPQRPVDSKLSCICHLESTLRHYHVEPHKPSDLSHVFPRPEVGHHRHHAPMSSSPKSPPSSTLTNIHVDPSDYPVRPSRRLSNYNHAPPCIVFVTHN